MIGIPKNFPSNDKDDDGDENEVVMSPLSQTVTQGRKSVKVEIFADVEGKWLLEIEDEYWNSTVWDDPFETDQEALDYALEAIRTEGIETFIGKPNSN